MNRRWLRYLLALASLSAPAGAAAAQEAAPAPRSALPAIHEGTIWTVDYVRARPRKRDACLQFYGANWAANRAAAKRAGLVLSYRIWTNQPVDPDDWDIMLLTEYRNLAALDGLEEKFRPILAARTRIAVPDLDVATDCVILGSRTLRQVEFGGGGG